MALSLLLLLTTFTPRKFAKPQMRMSGSGTHNLQVMRQNSFHWASAPWSYKIKWKFVYSFITVEIECAINANALVVVTIWKAGGLKRWSVLSVVRTQSSSQWVALGYGLEWLQSTFCLCVALKYVSVITISKFCVSYKATTNTDLNYKYTVINCKLLCWIARVFL